jgi:hypothetical protein
LLKYRLTFIHAAQVLVVRQTVCCKLINARRNRRVIITQ